MTQEWEVSEKLPRFDDRFEFEVQIHGHVRRARLSGKESLYLSPGTWYFTDCTNPIQNMIFNRDDVTAWRHKDTFKDMK